MKKFEKRHFFSYTNDGPADILMGLWMILAELFMLIEQPDFLFVMRQTGLTKGNLSSHLGKLEDGGLMDIKKEFVGKIPRTFLSLSKKGIDAFEKYQKQMQNFFQELPG